MRFRKLAAEKWRTATHCPKFFGDIVELQIGSTRLRGKSASFLDFLSINAGSSEDERWSLNGRFFDGTGEYLEIVDNIVKTARGAWDVQLIGPLFTIRRNSRDIALQLKIHDDCLSLERLELRWPTSSLRIDAEGKFILRTASIDCEIEDCLNQTAKADFSRIVGFLEPFPSNLQASGELGSTHRTKIFITGARRQDEMAAFEDPIFEGAAAKLAERLGEPGLNGPFGAARCAEILFDYTAGRKLRSFDANEVGRIVCRAQSIVRRTSGDPKS
jgi:hypothetical protein